MKRSAVFMAAGLVVAALIGFAGLNPYLPGGGDNAEYIAQAEALNQFGHRANLHLVGDPQDTFRPPLYPWLLAALSRICGRNVIAFKAVNVLFALGAIVAAWWFLIVALPPEQTGKGSGESASEEEEKGNAPDASALADAGWIAFWFALAPLLLYCTHDVLSDVPFTCLVLVALGCAARWERPKGVRWLAGCLVLLVIAMLVRTAAVLMAGALAGYFVINYLLRIRRPDRGRSLVMALVCFVFAGGLLFWSSRGKQTYLGPGQLQQSVSGQPQREGGVLGTAMREVAGRVNRLGYCYGVSLAGEVAAHDVDCPYFALPPLPMSLVAKLGKWSHWPRLVLVGLAAGWGCVLLGRRRGHMIPVVFLLYMGALLIWPFFDARFFLPVLPLFLALVWVGARDIIRGALRRGAIGAVSATAVLALIPMVCLLGALGGLVDVQPAFVTTVEWVVGTVLLGGLLIWVAARSANEELGGRLVRVLAVLILCLACVRSVDYNLVRERQWGPALPVEGWPEFYAAAKMIGEHAEPDDVIVSGKTSLVWFWTGLKGVPVPATKDPVAGSKAIEGAQWAVVDSLPDDRAAARYLLPLLAEDGENWGVWRQLASRDERGQPVGRTAIFRRRAQPGSTGIEREVAP